jgi:hypothetical protein
MGSKAVVAATAVGAFILAQTFVTSIMADLVLTVISAGVGFGAGWMLRK